MSSPEPRRRPAAVSRLVVPPDEPGPGYTQGSSLPSSSQSEAPQPAAQPPPRTPKPLRTIKHVPTPPAHVYRGDRVLMAVFATFMIMLLFAAAGVYQMKHRHQEAVTRQLRGRFEVCTICACLGNSCCWQLFSGLRGIHAAHPQPIASAIVPQTVAAGVCMGAGVHADEVVAVRVLAPLGCVQSPGSFNSHNISRHCPFDPTSMSSCPI